MQQSRPEQGRRRAQAFIAGVLIVVLSFAGIVIHPGGVLPRAEETPSAQPSNEETLGGPPASAYPIAELRALDKVTARVTTLHVSVGETARFGTLQIRPKVCDKRPPEETPEAAAFLDIIEQRPGKPEAGVFHGWMFASSPGLSAMQHPVYDLWMLDCLSSLPSAPANTSGGGSP